MIDQSHPLPQLIGAGACPALLAQVPQGLDVQEHKRVHAPPTPTPAENNNSFPCAECHCAPSPSDNHGMGITVAPDSRRRKPRLREDKRLAKVTQPVSSGGRIQIQSSQL